MAITITDTALDNLGAPAPAAAISIGQCDVYGELVSPPAFGPYTLSADGAAAFSQAVQQSIKYRISITASGGSVVRRFVDAPAAGGPYTMDAIAFTPTPKVDTTLGTMSADAAQQREPRGLIPFRPFSNGPDGIPGFLCSAFDDTFVLTASRDYFAPMVVEHPIEVAGGGFYLPGAPGANGKARVGIYTADDDWHPANLLLDSGEISITLGVGGSQSFTQSIELPPNRYIVAFTCNQAYTVRRHLGVSLAGTAQALGGSMIDMLYQGRAFGAFPNPYSWAGNFLASNVHAWAIIPLLTWSAA